MNFFDKIRSTVASRRKKPAPGTAAGTQTVPPPVGIPGTHFFIAAIPVEAPHRIDGVGVVVPECDFNLLKTIRILAAKGESLTIDSESKVLMGEQGEAAWDYHNAKMLHDYYGIDADMLLQLTGFHISDK